MRVEGEKNKAPLGKRTGIHELRLIELFTHYTGLLVPVCVCERESKRERVNVCLKRLKIKKKKTSRNLSSYPSSEIRVQIQM